jgi:hypothetical protein
MINSEKLSYMDYQDFLKFVLYGLSRLILKICLIWLNLNIFITLLLLIY